jgi:hypothetical protein
MPDILQIHADILLREIERLKALYPELEDDPVLLADTVEGSTRFEAVLDRLNVAFLEVVGLREATVMLQQTMKDRAERFNRRSEGIKGLMLAVMRAAGKQTVTLPSGTLSIAKGRDVLELDEDFHAQGYMRVKQEPMKADILAALKLGNEIPGARLATSPEHLQVRTK